MSTTAPIKDKKISTNYTNILAGKGEEPSSFDFTNERNLREKKKKGYDTHYTYATEDGHTSFIVERKYTDEAREKKQFILHSKWKNGVDDSQRWIAKAAPEPRVIWNLPKLKVAKTNRVLVAEGFDATKMNQVLGLREQGLCACVVVAMGYHAEDDFNAKLPKSRLDQEVIFTEI